MPTWIRRVSLGGNFSLAALCALGALAAMSKGQTGGLLILVLIGALAAFNIHVAGKAARLLSEEEWLAAEIRKAELRNKLAALQANNAAPSVRRLTHETSRG